MAQIAQTQELQRRARIKKTPQPPVSGWTKALVGVGVFAGLAFVAAAVVIPLYLVPILTATTIAATSQTESKTTAALTTATTSNTTAVANLTTTATLYIPSNYYTACSATCSNVTTTTVSTLLASWPFENNLLDSMNTYAGTMTGSVAFISGYVSQALVLNGAQYMTISSPFLTLANRSFTFEAWIMLTTLSPSGDIGIFGQCQAYNTRQCLHFLIRSNKVFLGFFSDDVIGSTSVSANTWMHAAYMYDLSTNTKSVYLNGILDGSTTGGSFYQGTSGVMYVGYATHSGIVAPLTGYIDQVTLSNRAKTPCEILNDASLVTRFSFDNVITDSGPNHLPSYTTQQSNSGLSYVTGRVNQGLMLAATVSFFQACSFYWLGHNNQPFSFTLWIKPTVRAGTLVHLSSERTGSGGWCLPKLGFSSSGALVAQSWMGSVVTITGPMIPTNNWTHIAQTWSSTNGLRLYINGGLYGSVAMATFNAYGAGSMCFFLGTSGLGTNCQTSAIVMGSYSGALDEFYVYDREITQAEVCPLAHP